MNPCALSGYVTQRITYGNANHRIHSYALSWLVTLPLEIVAASITVGYWPGSRNVNPAAWVTIFLAVIISINLFGVRGYGEAEFVFSIIKVTAVIGFMSVLPVPSFPVFAN